MPVEALNPTQYYVRIDRLQWLAAGNTPEGDDYPHVVTWRGKTYLYDGHHRWMLASLTGVAELTVRNFIIEPVRERVNRPWSEYPEGTRAYAIGGGYWHRVTHGWKWFNGSTFPTPGGDAFEVELP